MQRRQRVRAFWITLIGMMVLSGVAIPLWVMADSGEVSLTATLYADVVRFEADGVASMRVTIYDLSENELWTSGQVMSAFVDWDRSNTYGERLANGYYLYLAQGWDVSEQLVLNKAGKVVLLPGDQVELKTAPSVAPPAEAPADRISTPTPKAYSYSNLSISGNLGIGVDPGAFPIDIQKAVGWGSLGFQMVETNRPMTWRFEVIGDGVAGRRGNFEITELGVANHFVIAPGGNIGIGTTSPAEELDVAGDINMSGFLYRGGSTFLHNDATNFNTFVGRAAGNLTMSGGQNTGVGDSVLASLTTGSANTAVGENALLSNSTGHFNTAVGDDSMFGNVGGQYNTCVGDNTLVANTAGSANTAVGQKALEDNVSSNNTAIGYNALLDLSSGSDNVALGHTAGQYCSSGNHNVYISNGGTDESNTIRIGDSNQTRTYISGIYNVAIAGGVSVSIDSNGSWVRPA